jgi:hypothetical protein
MQQYDPYNRECNSMIIENLDPFIFISGLKTVMFTTYIGDKYFKKTTVMLTTYLIELVASGY